MPDSGWVEDSVDGGYIDEAPYDAFEGGSYIPLNAALAAKKAIVNVKNNDDECLRWVLKSARFPVAKNGDRTSGYPENDGLNWEEIEFPVKVPQIRKLEKQNVGLAINVFGWENDDLTILWISDKRKAIKRINLTLVMDGENSHYCWIKSIGRLLESKTKGTAGGRQYYCDVCLSRFTNERVLETHQELCEGVNERPMRRDMPKKGENALKYKNHHKQQKAPYTIYADFESIIEVLPQGERGRMEQTEKNGQRF